MQDATSQPLCRTGFTRRTLLGAAARRLLPHVLHALSSYAGQEQIALTDALRNTSAVATIPHQQSGRTLVVAGNMEPVDTPGSILKPLLLFAALQQNLVAPTTTTVFCTYPQTSTIL